MKNPSSKNISLKQKDGRLYCPSCGESLARQDVESYFCCPYCDYKFTLNGEMEDYLLKPVVDNWVQVNFSQQSQQFPAEQENSRSNWI